MKIFFLFMGGAMSVVTIGFFILLCHSEGPHARRNIQSLGGIFAAALVIGVVGGGVLGLILLFVFGQFFH